VNVINIGEAGLRRQNVVIKRYISTAEIPHTTAARHSYVHDVILLKHAYPQDGSCNVIQ